MKRTLCILLSLMLAVTGLVGLGVSVSATNVGDIILFGNYPQTQVGETTALKNAANAATWNSYGYYTGNGIYDGNMTASDFMKYADFSLNGVKYRAVKFTKYRPNFTNQASIADSSCQDENGYSPNTTYYFKYEPLKWRVLDPSTCLILCETIIDAQAYQNVVRKSDDGRYLVGTTSTYANNYASSTIRTWLNNDFYNIAFNGEEKEKIKNTTINNDAFSSAYSKYNAESTTDPIFLLSISEARNPDYDLLSPSARTAKGTSYAKCQGLYVNWNGNTDFSSWWLRTAGIDSLGACGVNDDGWFGASYPTSRTQIGIRPACILSNLTTEVYTVTATANPAAGGTVTGSGTYTDGKTATVTATANSGYIFSGWYNGSTKVSSSKSYTFTVTENVTLTAKFSKLSMGYAVNANAEPAEGGTVTGDGAYSNGQTAALTATANSGWHFTGWFDGSNKVSSDASYSFTVTGNVTLTAKFEKDASVSYTVTVTGEPAEGGTVTGGGTYNSGAYATLTATPNSGWHFVGWYQNGSQVSTQQSFFRPVVSDLVYVAKFEKDAPVNPTQNATLNVPQSTEVGYKSTVTVTTTAEGVPEGFFVALYDGDTQLAKGDNKTVSYTMPKMKSGKTLTAKIIDSNGNVQSNADGKLEKEIKITVKTGFFDKVKAFFLGLFGLLPKITLNP